ncbi:MAG: F0F1 ATP synthase subunit epsilon [Gammaproteobacteria bacterium]|nr:F0F1 ATP synthase subunit epsilon [Gammaproteobacteria bacterium]
MRLEVFEPTRVVVVAEATRVFGEAANGAFCLLPRHVDFVTALVPGVLEYLTPQGAMKLIAVDEGVLVKAGEQVRVSTRRAVEGEDLETLRDTVVSEFRHHDEHDRIARSALARLEASVVRCFIGLR